MRNWLKEKRTESGKTVSEICKGLGDISESYYFLIEGGKRMESLDVDFMGKLGKVFNMSIQEIVDAELREKT